MTCILVVRCAGSPSQRPRCEPATPAQWAGGRALTPEPVRPLPRLFPGPRAPPPPAAAPQATPPPQQELPPCWLRQRRAHGGPPPDHLSSRFLASGLRYPERSP
eukprot:364750-Chlamydomonas_euryale.AAC.15